MRRESLRILEPCSADWERMDGDGAVRFCRLCNKNVHDISQLPEDQARALLAAGPQPCIRYQYDAQGEVLFADRPGLFPRLAAAAALAFGSLVAGGCMGKMACPEPPPDPVRAGEPSEPVALDAEPSADAQPVAPENTAPAAPTSDAP